MVKIIAIMIINVFLKRKILSVETILRAYTHACTRARAHTHTYTHSLTHARTHTHTHTLINTHTHTHTHTHLSLIHI